jgi:DNA-binding NtrC family response regulator
MLKYKKRGGEKIMESKKPRILVVDDERGIRESIALLLSSDYEVLTAPEGEAALRIVSENDDIDLAILDIKMPKMDGLQVLEGIKEINGDITVLMLTALKDINLAVESIKLGAYDYITKPFEADDLKKLIKQALDKIPPREGLYNPAPSEESDSEALFI